jgi:hypothetical protein
MRIVCVFREDLASTRVVELGGGSRQPQGRAFEGTAGEGIVLYHSQK